MLTLGSRQTTVGKSHTHITPKWILDRLGPFDLDPCAADPRPWDCAKVSITERENGLAHPWRGRVFLNPPFDRYQVARWIQRLADHGQGIALLMRARRQIGLSRCGSMRRASCSLTTASSSAGPMEANNRQIAGRLWCWSPSAHRISCSCVRPGSLEGLSPNGNTRAPCRAEDPRHLLFTPKVLEPVGAQLGVSDRMAEPSLERSRIVAVRLIGQSLAVWPEGIILHGFVGLPQKFFIAEKLFCGLNQLIPRVLAVMRSRCRLCALPRKVSAELPQSASYRERSGQLAPTWVGTLSENSTASPRPGSGAGRRGRPGAELLSDDPSTIDLSPQTRPLATRRQEVCRCCSARQIVRRAIGRVLVLAQPSQRQADCAWTVGFAAANSLPYRWQLRLRDQSSSRKTRGTVFCDNLAFDALDFNIYTVANLASIAGAGSQ
jgi:hypothetical protein